MSEIETQKIQGKPEFSQDKATLLLLIDKHQLPLQEKHEIARQLSLQEKSEFHLTVIGSDTGRQILARIASIPEENRKQYIQKIQELVLEKTWQLSPTQNFFYVEKTYPSVNKAGSEESAAPEQRASIILEMRIPELQDFYQKLNTLLQSSFPEPFPHVTLFTSSTNKDNMTRGIGLYSYEEFEQLLPKKI